LQGDLLKEEAAVAKRKKVGLRPGAKRLSVYNEGLCVYVRDDGQDAALRALIASRKFGKQDPQATFYERLALPAFGNAVARDGLAFAFDLQQDDEIDIEVLVGPPLTPAQLADALWMVPQTTWLRLPTGLLRIDTPNTMSLDPDPGDDPGGVAKVPPGDYEIRLYRVDWDAMHREERDDDYDGPGHLLVLTPLAGKPRATSSILRFPEVTEALSDASACKVQEARFETKIMSDYWWEPFHLDLDREAAAALALKPGSLFEICLEKPRFALTAVFLDRRLDNEMRSLLTDRAPTKEFAKALDRLAADYPDAAVALWNAHPESQRELLLLVRWKGKNKYPAKFHGLWAPCAGRRLDTASPFTDLLAKAKSASSIIDPARLQAVCREAENAIRIENMEHGIEDTQTRPKGVSRSDLHEICVDRVGASRS
jgi:hypothetical protein